MADEITIRNIDVALTKVRIEPGDVLVIECDHRLREESHLNIRREISESFGCAAVVLDGGIKLAAVLSISQECLQLASQERAKRASRWAAEMRERLREVQHERP